MRLEFDRKGKTMLLASIVFFSMFKLLLVFKGTDERTKLVRRKSTGLVDLDNAYPVGT
ncbi:hypothetical protein P4V60_29425 [Brevibacillus porteri]|uniref:hypothetical protein n=1 Tax=Brevibacillus porteri TaxID=2126350 RepID=UPI002E1C4FF9|nr:hypothetical protein [Brevibacillus porteri]MED2131124.1 hypothetical protein [Brevibacillus porteri]